MRRLLPVVPALFLLGVSTLTLSCASLGTLRGVVRPPQFEEAEDRLAELRLVGAQTGGLPDRAVVRLWSKVTNPNPFGLTLDTVSGTFFLEGSRAAETDFPLGLPLEARGESIIPLDVTIRFDDLPRLADIVRDAYRNRELEYRLEGTVGVEAGALGDLSFGPMTLLEGELTPRL